jgi:hypothetical protein
MSDEAVAVPEQATGPEWKSIVVEVEETETGRTRKKQFDGVWLIGDENGAEDFQHDNGSLLSYGGGYSVALTKRNAIVIFDRHHDGSIVRHNIFESFDDLRRDEHFPQSLISAVAGELGVEYIEEMDV